MKAFLLTVIVLCVATSSVIAQQKIAPADNLRKPYERTTLHFPLVDYNEPNPQDTDTNRATQEKRKRFNHLGNWVSINPQSYISESQAIAHGEWDFPALPVAKSHTILIGVVGETKANLSENKRNVFSEFNVAVETVFKTNNEGIKQGSVVALNRMGGFVRYPNGHSVLYRRASMYMPRTGGRYLFFLNLLNPYDYGIMTAYELTATGVIPLDIASQCLELEGRSETEILRQVRASLASTEN